MQKRVPQDEFTATIFSPGRAVAVFACKVRAAACLAVHDAGTDESGRGLFHLIIWIVDVGPDGRCLAVDAGFSRAARLRERKVRTPQSSVPDNVRDVGFKLNGRKVPQKTYRPGLPG